ncbi:MAG: prepilin-type N-terminal cleavage/methylation domain-containing protein [Candidatus Muiribacteriaceae bacterium]
MRSRFSEGFTIIEIMIVVIIISILVYFATLNLSGNRRNAEEARIMSDLANLKKAFSLYAMSENGRYPSTLIELRKSGVVRTLPRDPWGNDYTVNVRDGAVYVGTYVKGTYEVKVGIQQ